MESGFLVQFKDMGLAMVLALSAMGSASGAGIAGMAAIGAWKKNFMQNKAASFMLIAFVGAPLTQTIYGMILMNRMAELAIKGQYLLGIGAFAGSCYGVICIFSGQMRCSCLRRNG